MEESTEQLLFLRYECGQSFMQSKRKKKQVDLVPLMSVYLLWLIRHVAEIHRLSLGFLWTFCKERKVLL